jgi:HEAT repeat protein
VNLSVDESALPPELLADDPLSQALVDLKSDDFVRRRSAAIQLRRLRPTQKKQQVARLLEKMLKDPDPQTCQCAAEALGTWGTEESVPLLIELLGDNSVFVRWAAIDSLGTLKDPRAAEAVAARLTEQKDAGKANFALQKLGPAAEDAVLPYLEHHRWQVRVQVCHVLKEIGTKKSVPALRALARRRRGSDFLVAVAAAEALEAAGTRAAPPKKDPAP